MSMPWDDLQEEIPPPGAEASRFDVGKEQLYVVNMKGINTLVPGRLMPDGQAVAAEFVWVRDGLLRRSLGSQQLGDAPWQADSLTKPLLLTMFRKHNTDGTTTKRWIAIIGGVGSASAKFYEFDGTNWQVRATGLTIDPYTAAQYQNRMYITNGAGQHHWDGTTFSAWTLGFAGTQPPVAVHRAEEAHNDGHLIAGTYKMAYSFYKSSTGEETIASTTLTRVFVASSGDNLWYVDIPTPHNIDQSYDTIKFYRSARNGSDLKYEWSIGRWYNAPSVAFINATFGTSVAVGDEVGAGVAVGYQADTNLTVAPLDSTTAGEPPNGRGIAVWDDRIWLFAMDDAPSTMRFSERGKPNSFPPLNEVIVDRYDGFGFTGAKVYNGRFYAWVQNTSYTIEFDQITQYGARRQETGYGLAHHNAVIEASNKLFGLGYGTLWVVDGGPPFTEISYPWSERIKELSTGASWTAPVHLAFDQVADRRRLLMCAPYRSNVEQPAAFIETNGDFVDWQDRNEIVATGERSDGSPWIVTLTKTVAGLVEAREWFTNSDSEDIYETNEGTYETRDIDTDPRIVDKLFIAADFMLKRPPSEQDGRIMWSAAYNASDDFSESGDIPRYPDSRKSSLWHRELFQQRGAAQTIRMRFTLPEGYPTILALRLWWKPYGDKTRQ